MDLPIWLSLTAIVLLVISLSAYLSWLGRRRLQLLANRPVMASAHGVTLARTLLSLAGLPELPIASTSWRQADRYEFAGRRLVFSTETCWQPSVAGLAIVAHEIGHAEQHLTHYLPQRLHRSLASLSYACLALAPILSIMALIVGQLHLFAVTLTLVAPGFLAYLLLLVIENDASRRGMRLLRLSHQVTSDDCQQAQSFLDAAMLTYLIWPLLMAGRLFYFALISIGDAPAMRRAEPARG